MDDTAEKLRENPETKDYYLGMTDFGRGKRFSEVKHYSEERDGSLNPYTS